MVDAGRGPPEPAPRADLDPHGSGGRPQQRAWAYRRRRAVGLPLLWGIALLFVCAGVLLIASLDPGSMGLGAALVSVANSFALGVLWFLACTMLRRMQMPAWFALACVWLAHQLPRELGRLGMMLAGPYDSHPVLVALFLVLTLAISLWLLLASGPARQIFPQVAGKLDGQAGAARQDGLGLDNQDNPGRLAGSAGQDSSSLEHALATAAQRFMLTPREIDTARLMARGRSKAVIAEMLCLSENTVRTHGRNLYAKLGVHTRQELLDLLENLERAGADGSAPGSPGGR